MTTKRPFDSVTCVRLNSRWMLASVRGRYNVAKLVAQYGRRGNVTKWIVELARQTVQNQSSLALTAGTGESHVGCGGREPWFCH
jgi:hypothetical protein